MDNRHELERMPSRNEIFAGRILSFFLFLLSLAILYFTTRYFYETRSGLTGLIVAMVFTFVMGYLLYRIFVTRPIPLERRASKTLAYLFIIAGFGGLLGSLFLNQNPFYLTGAGITCIYYGSSVFVKNHS